MRRARSAGTRSDRDRRAGARPRLLLDVALVTGVGGIGRALLAMGLVLAAVGALLLVSERFPGLRLGRLPGDLSFSRGSFRLYVPVATSLVISAVVSLVLWLLSRRR